MTTARTQSQAPIPRAPAMRAAAQAFAQGGILTAFEALHEVLGDVFQLPLPGFRSVVLVGPEAARFVLTESREGLLWRAERDPVTQLLRRGMLVTDGAEHDELRRVMTPALHHRLFEGFTRTIVKNTDRVTPDWSDGARIYLLEEMRRIALLCLMGSLYDEDFAPRMRELEPAIERTIRYISPGLWLIWPALPRPGYRAAIQRLDRYFYQLIARRRVLSHDSADLVSILIAAGLSDDLIRDQLLTMFIAGHDTSTALLAWSLALLTSHPEALAAATAEVDATIGPEEPTYTHLRQLTYLDQVIKEALRLYPPIHLGSRIAATDLTFGAYRIPRGTRVLYSIYLTHRDRRLWPAPDRFDPERFSRNAAGRRAAYSYLPFGGGPRNCIGAAFAQIEAKLVLARLLQQFAFRPSSAAFRVRMRATLEPHPRMWVEARRRQTQPSSPVS